MFRPLRIGVARSGRVSAPPASDLVQAGAAATLLRRSHCQNEATPLPRELFELASEIFFFRSCDIEMDSAPRMASREPSVLRASNQR